MANQATGLTRIIKAAGYSYKGLSAAWQHEAAFARNWWSPFWLSYWLSGWMWVR